MKRWKVAVVLAIGTFVLTQAGSAQDPLDPLTKGERRQSLQGGLPDLLFQVLDVDRDGPYHRPRSTPRRPGCASEIPTRMENSPLTSCHEDY